MFDLLKDERKTLNVARVFFLVTLKDLARRVVLEKFPQLTRLELVSTTHWWIVAI